VGGNPGRCPGTQVAPPVGRPARAKETSLNKGMSADNWNHERGTDSARFVNRSDQIPSQLTPGYDRWFEGERSGTLRRTPVSLP
jgi:hypothetical protein